MLKAKPRGQGQVRQERDDVLDHEPGYFVDVAEMTAKEAAEQA